MSDGPIDLTFIGRQLKQLATEVAIMRNDMTVLTAVVMRREGILSSLSTEVCAVSAAGRTFQP